MKIIYTYIATDETTHTTALPSCCVNYTLYPGSFVATNSNFAMWESDDK